MTELRAIDRLVVFIQYLCDDPRSIVANTSAFEKVCGLSNGYVYTTSRGKGSIGSDVLAKIYCTFPELNLAWICTGIGKMLLDKKTVSRVLSDARRLKNDTMMYPKNFQK